MEAEAVVARSARQFRNLPGGLLPLLQAIQSVLGRIPADAVPAIAEGLLLSRAGACHATGDGAFAAESSGHQPARIWIFTPARSMCCNESVSIAASGAIEPSPRV